MKKSNFMQGAFLATLGIVITKVIGILYVIPFYQIIGDKGGALYGYAYNIYNIFLNISYAGLPMAISKIISEYNALGFEEDKKQAFKIGKRLAILLSEISFFILFLFAPQIAYIIMGDIEGGNTIEEITLVIRIISSAIIVVPLLSIYRGYFQGHKYIKPTSISEIIEQVVRVSFILIGSFLTLKVFHLSLTTTVGVALFGATVGAFVSYFYIIKKYQKNIQEFEKKSNIGRITTDKQIFKQIIIYALPLILIDIFKSLYNSIDIMMLVKTLVNRIGYSIRDAESIMSVLSTWGAKLNMIITSIGSGIVISLVPNLSENYIMQDQVEVNKKVNKSFIILLFFTLPMTIGLSLLTKPIWMIFYGYNEIGFTTFSYSVFTALFLGMFLTMITIIQLLKDYKCVIVCLIIGLLTKISLNIPLILLSNQIALPAQYGATTATIIGYLVPFIISLIRLKKKYQIKFHEALLEIKHIIIATLIMTVVIKLIQLTGLNYSLTRIVNIPIVLFYTLIGSLVYFVYGYKTGLMARIFGMKVMDKIHQILHIKKDNLDN